VISGRQHYLFTANHGLYGSTSCCISHGPCQWERAIFDPHPHSSETPQPIFMKLEIYNCLQDMTHMQNFRGGGAMSTWVAWVNSQFDAFKFLSFLLRRRGPPCSRTLPGVRKTKFYMWPPLTPFAQENVKFGTLSWWSGTVRHIHFKLDHPSDITWHDSRVKRSKVKVTRAHNVYR